MMLERIEQIANRYEAVEYQMADPAVSSDHEKLMKLAQEHADMKPVVTAYKRHQEIVQEAADVRALIQAEDDADMKSMAQEELKALETEQETLEKSMIRLLIPKDPRDDRNVYIEIRAGTGGDEAALFAADLLRMYTRYAETQGFKVHLMDENFIGIGGYKEVIVMMKGRGAFSRFKYESGIHRVQRVPKTESQGRIHTSAATVAVMPEVDKVNITLDERDLEIKAEFSSGPGGQHMQKNATAARIIHKPTGLMVKIQSERSLTQNKELGKAIIQARIQEAEVQKRADAIAGDRKDQVGSGDRSGKIRTYNYPQSRVTDHRIGFTSHNLQSVIDGDLNPFIDALTVDEEARKLTAMEADQSA